MLLINVKERLINREKYAILFIFSIASLVRAVPELIAYPYPLGYDVINYYIPVVTNFDKYWPIISGQFPCFIASRYKQQHWSIITFSTFCCYSFCYLDIWYFRNLSIFYRTQNTEN